MEATRVEVRRSNRLADAAAELIFGGFAALVTRALVPGLPYLAVVAGIIAVYVEARRHAREREVRGSTHQGVRREWLVFIAILCVSVVVVIGFIVPTALGRT